MSSISSLNALNANYFFGTQNKKKQDSIAQLWSNYSSFQSNATGALAGLTEINTNLKSVLSSYDDAKNAFNSELEETLGDLSKSAAKVKSYNFNVDKENAITTSSETDKDGKVTTTTTYSKDLQAAIDTVKDFVSDYNTSIKFFKDNAEVSKRVGNMAKVFGDTTFRSSLYEAIGLTPGTDGSLSINEDKLANAILNDPNKVSRTLGQDGLAVKAENHISFARNQADKLFPTAQAMLGDQLETAALYTGKAYRNMAAYTNMGNLLNMMF